MTRWPYPRIVAHRGGGTFAPENTLGAIRFGAALGFRGVEFDVMLAGDGTPVLFHDETLKRTTGRRGRVSNTDFETLEQLDAEAGLELANLMADSTLCLPELRRGIGEAAETGSRLEGPQRRGRRKRPIAHSH